MPENPYEPPKGESEPSGERFRESVAHMTLIGLIAIAMTAVAFTFAAAWVLDDWPWELSSANLQFSLLHGLAWGIFGAVISLGAYVAAEPHKLPIAVSVALAWATMTAIGFFLYILIFMMG